MKSNARIEAAKIAWARFSVWCFQMNRILRGQVVWQEEVYRERLKPKGPWRITYVGVVKVPQGAKWPYDVRITRKAFYNRPVVKECHVVDEHATQHR